MQVDEVARLRKQVRALYRRMQRDAPAIEGLPYTAIQMLVAVERSSAPIRPSELAAELRMTTSNVAAALRSLEAQGMVSRHADPSDGRKAFVALTDHGKRAVTEARSNYHARFQAVMDDVLTEDEQQLLLRAGDLMQRLADHDGPVAGDGAAPART